MNEDLVLWECPICGYQITDTHHAHAKLWWMCVACERVRLHDFIEIRLPPGPAHALLKRKF